MPCSCFHVFYCSSLLQCLSPAGRHASRGGRLRGPERREKRAGRAGWRGGTPAARWHTRLGLHVSLPPQVYTCVVCVTLGAPVRVRILPKGPHPPFLTQPCLPHAGPLLSWLSGVLCTCVSAAGAARPPGSQDTLVPAALRPAVALIVGRVLCMPACARRALAHPGMGRGCWCIVLPPGILTPC